MGQDLQAPLPGFIELDEKQLALRTGMNIDLFMAWLGTGIDTKMVSFFASQMWVPSDDIRESLNDRDALYVYYGTVQLGRFSIVLIQRSEQPWRERGFSDEIIFAFNADRERHKKMLGGGTIA